MTALSQPIGRSPTRAHDARRVARRRGAFVGVAVALGVAGLQALAATEVVLDVSVGLVGAVPALLCGAWLGPRAATPALRDAVLTIPAMAAGVVLLADAVLVGSLLASARDLDPAAIVVVPYLYVIGLVLVGIPMLAVTVPSSIAWLVLVRAWGRR